MLLYRFSINNTYKKNFSKIHINCVKTEFVFISSFVSCSLGQLSKRCFHDLRTAKKGRFKILKPPIHNNKEIHKFIIRDINNNCYTTTTTNNNNATTNASITNKYNFRNELNSFFIFSSRRKYQNETNETEKAKGSNLPNRQDTNNEHVARNNRFKLESNTGGHKPNENSNILENEKTILIKDIKNIDEDIKKSLLTVFQYKELTDVQHVIYENIIKQNKENDLLIQAKTGSGKTIAYLLLVINDLLQNSLLSVHTLILVPTRELANQIYNEAKMLLAFKKNINVLTLIGGIQRREDQINIRRVKPDIIIATVGRLLDHFECTYLFNTLFQNLRMLIIDEADQLLSHGYFDEISRILTYLPPNKKNILLSATISHNLENIRKKMCRENYIFLNCIPDASQHTNEQLKQYVIFHKAIDTTVILYNILVEHMQKNQLHYKIIVFFPTARATSFYAQFFKNQIKIAVYELHKKKEPTQRQIISNRFAVETTGILFTSDISSRGVDYPNVTLIVQVNCAISREQYIHRVGRTARKKKEGSSILLLNEADQLFFQQIKDLSIYKIQAEEYAQKNANVVQYLSSWMSNAQLLYLAYSFYSSLLRFYKTKYIQLKLNDDDIIDVVNNVLLSTGLMEQPHISTKLAITLNMQNNKKLKIRKDLDELTI